MLRILTSFILTCVLSGCSGTWQENGRVGLKYTFEAVKTAKDVGVSMVHQRCMKVAKKCKAETPGVCPALKSCQADRHKVEDAALAANRLMAAALLSIAVGNKEDATAAIPKVAKQAEELYKLLKKLGVM